MHGFPEAAGSRVSPPPGNMSTALHCRPDPLNLATFAMLFKAALTACMARALAPGGGSAAGGSLHWWLLDHDLHFGLVHSADFGGLTVESFPKVSPRGCPNAVKDRQCFHQSAKVPGL
jgi:hypothetical protein